MVDLILKVHIISKNISNYFKLSKCSYSIEMITLPMRHRTFEVAKCIWKMEQIWDSLCMHYHIIHRCKSFWFSVVVGRSEWHFCNNAFEQFIANFQIDWSANFSVAMCSIAHSDIAAKTWTRTSTGHFTDLLAIAENLNAMPGSRTLFQSNTNTTTTTAIFHVIQNHWCTRKVCFGTATFC